VEWKRIEAAGLVGSILFAVVLAGWGVSFLWGPIADRFDRTRALAATILVYALFTGLAAFATNVWHKARQHHRALIQPWLASALVALW
jgi:MFS family permease